MLELYHNNISVCAQKVRIVLAEKNVPWTNHHLSLARGEQLTPEFKKMNPRGVVPVLVHDGNVIVEFERDLRLPRRGVPEPAADAEKPGRARHDAAVVQAARRHPAHGLRHGELCDLVRPAAQEADGRGPRGAADEDAGSGAARPPARADREGHRDAVLPRPHQGVREDLRRDGGAARQDASGSPPTPTRWPTSRSRPTSSGSTGWASPGCGRTGRASPTGSSASRRGRASRRSPTIRRPTTTTPAATG